MSLATTAVARTARPEVRPEPSGAPQRRLQAVPSAAPRRRPRLGYAIVAFAGAVAIAVAQMSLSVLTTQSSYELAALNQERRTATLQAQELRDEVAGLSSPQYLAANAAALGMVIDGAPSYLRLSDGKVVGSGDAAGSVSTVDAAKRGAVGNALLERRPLTTDPGSTLEGKKQPATPAPPAEKPEAELPPPLTEGLPSPTTR
jgi:cell division protein FtsL